MRVAIIGQGYVGTELGKAAQRVGHDVVGIDINYARLESLIDIGYQTSSAFSEISNSDIVVLTVPTPLDENRKPDLSFIEQACDSMNPYLKDGALIINESTSYPGTLRDLISKKLGESRLYASAPERVDPGNLRWTIETTPRLLGALSQEALELAYKFYKTMTDEIVLVSSPEVAEAAKLFENTFRQVNIALVNEFAQIANALKIPTIETIEAAATKPYGFMKFLPGIGVGGHCIPIDPSYLSYKASQVGIRAKFINLANDVNLDMPYYVARKIDEVYSIRGKRVQVAGISYKENVSDIRESPALVLINELRDKGALVTWHDDHVKSYRDEVSQPIHEVNLGIICVGHAATNYSKWLNSGTTIIDVSSTPNTGFAKFL